MIDLAYADTVEAWELAAARSLERSRRRRRRARTRLLATTALGVLAVIALALITARVLIGA